MTFDHEEDEVLAQECATSALDDVSTYDLPRWDGPDGEAAPPGEDGAGVGAWGPIAPDPDGEGAGDDGAPLPRPTDQPERPPSLAAPVPQAVQDLEIVVQIRVLPGGLLAPRALCNIGVPGTTAHLCRLDMAADAAADGGVGAGRLGAQLATALSAFLVDRAAAAERAAAEKAVADAARKVEAQTRRKEQEARRRDERRKSDLRAAAERLGITLPTPGAAHAPTPPPVRGPAAPPAQAGELGPAPLRPPPACPADAAAGHEGGHQLSLFDA